MNFGVFRFIITLAIPIITTVNATGNCVTGPGYPPGSTSIWVQHPDCPRGGTYNTDPNIVPQRHCHCWSYCGYTCDIIPPPTTSTTTTTTLAPTPDPNLCSDPLVSDIPPGATYHRSPGCPAGSTYIRTSPYPRQHCNCTRHCGYFCIPIE